MIKYFTIANCLSFHEKQTLDMTPEALREYKDYLHTAEEFDRNLKLLKSAGIYGFNAHGKTNLVKAYKMFTDLLFSPVIDIRHFQRDASCKEQPSMFEIEFLLGSTKYRYGFVIKHNVVDGEWLYYTEARVRENYLFLRDSKDIKVSKLWNKQANGDVACLATLKQPHQLLLSGLIARNNIPRAIEIAKWFSGNIVIPDTFTEEHEEWAIKTLFHKDYHDLICEFLKNVDLGLCMDRINLLSCHEYNAFNPPRISEIFEGGSAGAIKYFILSCYLAYAIGQRQLVIIDELDSKLHTFLVQYLVKTYNDHKINHSGSQLIFTTHNTTLLANRLFRRDQFLLVEKNKLGASSLKKMYTTSAPIRKDASMEKEYIQKAFSKLNRVVADRLQHAPEYQPV